MNVREVTDIAVKAGEMLLTSGAEIYRVEDTISRICKAYNIKCESFVLPAGIFISAYNNQGDIVSLVKRIRERTINLEKIELVNSFSRSLSSMNLDYEGAMKKLNEIEKVRGFSFIVKIMAASFTAFIFVLLFHGSINEGIAAAFISAVIYMLKEKVLLVGIFPFLGYFISGIVAGGMSLLFASFFPNLNIYKIIIGSIIILLPGMAMTNGIKDAMYGDITSSLNRLSEGVFTVTATGAGVALALFLFLR